MTCSRSYTRTESWHTFNKNVKEVACDLGGGQGNKWEDIYYGTWNIKIWRNLLKIMYFFNIPVYVQIYEFKNNSDRIERNNTIF